MGSWSRIYDKMAYCLCFWLSSPTTFRYYAKPWLPRVPRLLIPEACWISALPVTDTYKPSVVGSGNKAVMTWNQYDLPALCRENSQLTRHNGFRQWFGAGQATGHKANQCWTSYLTLYGVSPDHNWSIPEVQFSTTSSQMPYHLTVLTHKEAHWRLMTLPCLIYEDCGARSRYQRQRYVIPCHSILWGVIIYACPRYPLLAPYTRFHGRRHTHIYIYIWYIFAILLCFKHIHYKWQQSDILHLSFLRFFICS